MRVLWDKGNCTSNVIVEEVAKEHEWNDKTIRTLINRLVSKAYTFEIKGNSMRELDIPAELIR